MFRRQERTLRAPNEIWLGLLQLAASLQTSVSFAPPRLPKLRKSSAKRLGGLYLIRPLSCQQPLRPNDPGVSIAPAHISADARFAIWNFVLGIRRTPATSGTAARIGPKNRPKNTVAIPHPLNHSEVCFSRSGFREIGQVLVNFGPSQTASSNAAQSPRNAPATAPAYEGRNPMPAAPISAPIPNRTKVAGTIKETNAKDSRNDRKKTSGGVGPLGWTVR